MYNAQYITVVAPNYTKVENKVLEQAFVLTWSVAAFNCAESSLEVSQAGANIASSQTLLGIIAAIHLNLSIINLGQQTFLGIIAAINLHLSLNNLGQQRFLGIIAAFIYCWQ